MAGFVLYLLGRFALRCRMVEFHPKSKKSEFPLGNVEGIESTMQSQNQMPFTTENTEKTKIITQQRAEALVRKIGEACDELERLAAENPELVGRVTHGAEEHKDAYLRLKARLELADEAPRCRWVRQDGTNCGSPQMKKHIYCFAHRQMMEARALALSLPAPEDANAIQIGIMRIQKALIEGTISTKSAGLLLYSMQLALQNVGQVTFGQAKTAELVTETVSEQEAFSQDQTPTTETRRHGKEQRQQQKPFTTEDTEGTEEGKTLPLINADDTDRKSGDRVIGTSGDRKGKTLPGRDADEHGLELPRPVEFWPSADMFRMDTREGREAYEASLRRKIKTSGDPGIGTSDHRGHLAIGAEQGCEQGQVPANLPPGYAKNRRAAGARLG
jgi:hypothetical protein